MQNDSPYLTSYSSIPTTNERQVRRVHRRYGLHSDSMHKHSMHRYDRHRYIDKPSFIHTKNMHKHTTSANPLITSTSSLTTSASSLTTSASSLARNSHSSLIRLRLKIIKCTNHRRKCSRPNHQQPARLCRHAILHRRLGDASLRPAGLPVYYFPTTNFS